MSRTARLRTVTHFDGADEADVFRIERDETGRVHLIDPRDNDTELSPEEARLLAKALLDAAGVAVVVPAPTVPPPTATKRARITGPVGAEHVTIGKVYEVVSINSEGAPVIVNDYGNRWELCLPGDTPTTLFPSWEWVS